MAYDADSDVVARYIDFFREEFKLDFRLSKAEVEAVMNERIRQLEQLKTLSSITEIARLKGFQKGLWTKSEIWRQIQNRTHPSMVGGKYFRSYDKWEPDQVSFVKDRLDLKDTLLRDRLNRTYGTYHTLHAVKQMKRRLERRS